MFILGISCYFHDSAACILKDGKILAAAEEERFTRVKHDNTFPINAINYCLKEAKINSDKLDYVVFYEKPFQKFERILQTSVENFPKSFKMFIEAIPQWIVEKIRMPSVIKDKIGFNGEVLFIPHHKSHAASAFLASPFEEAAIVTLDAIGEWTSTAIHYGQGNEIKTLKVINFPHSLGLFYSTITSYLGFKVLNDEYKVMGLAGWGRPTYYNKFKKLINFKEDGSFKLNMKYFSYPYSERMFSDELEKEFGKARKYGEEITRKHMDIAASLQKITEEIILRIVRHAFELTKSENLCMAGGVVLNSVVNGKILMSKIFKNIFFQPVATDSGGALGSALYVYNKILERKRKYIMKDLFLGPKFSSKEMKEFLESKEIKFEKLSDKEIVKATAEVLAENKIIGWFQDRMELGPRALGHRSILANPSNQEMKKILNEKVKHREWFRPFAPSLLLENVEDFFDFNIDMPFMIITLPVKKEKIKEIISATHIDGTARPQTTIMKRENLYHRLIEEFYSLTGVPAIINTSFNLRGEPIVCSLEDALNDYMKTKMDCLVVGNYFIEKGENE
ncbi:MAG: carbamoyltransferase [Candidatus Aenigmatarchaeota archaeon]